MNTVNFSKKKPEPVRFGLFGFKTPLESDLAQQLLGQRHFQTVAGVVENVQATVGHVARRGLRDRDLLGHQLQALLLAPTEN